MAQGIEKQTLHFSPRRQPATCTKIRDKLVPCYLLSAYLGTLYMHIPPALSSELSHIHYAPQDACLFLFIARKSVSQCSRLSSLQILSPQSPQKHPCRKVSSWNMWRPVITLLRTLELSRCPVSSVPATVPWDLGTLLGCCLCFENYPWFFSIWVGSLSLEAQSLIAVHQKRA